MGKSSLTGSALLSASTGGCAAEAAFMWAPTQVVGSLSSSTRCTSAMGETESGVRLMYPLCGAPSRFAT